MKDMIRELSSNMVDFDKQGMKDFWLEFSEKFISANNEDGFISLLDLCETKLKYYKDSPQILSLKELLLAEESIFNKDFESALGNNKNVTFFDFHFYPQYQKAIIYKNLNKFQDAAKNFEKAFHIKNNFTNLLTEIADCYFKAADFKNAKINYQKAKSYHELTIEQKKNLAICYYELEEHLSFQKLALKIQQEAKTPELYYLMAKSYEKVDSPENSLEYLEKSLDSKTINNSQIFEVLKYSIENNSPLLATQSLALLQINNYDLNNHYVDLARTAFSFKQYEFAHKLYELANDHVYYKLKNQDHKNRAILFCKANNTDDRYDNAKNIILDLIQRNKEDLSNYEILREVCKICKFKEAYNALDDLIESKCNSHDQIYYCLDEHRDKSPIIKELMDYIGMPPAEKIGSPKTLRRVSIATPPSSPQKATFDNFKGSFKTIGFKQEDSRPSLELKKPSESRLRASSAILPDNEPSSSGSNSGFIGLP